MPVLDEVDFLADTITAAAGQRVQGGVEVLVIDGGSRDGSRELQQRLAKQDERIRLLDNPDRIIPAALNIGLCAARAGYIVRMDAHTVYPHDYVARGIERLQRGDVEWVTGPAVPIATGGFARCVAAALRSRLGQGGSLKWSADPGGGEEIDLDAGVFAGVWRRATLERLGGWDTDFHVAEDAQMAARVLESHGRIVCLPEMAAHYAPRGTPAALWRQYWRFGRFRAIACRRHPIALRRSHLGPPALAGALATAALPGPLRRPARIVTAAWAVAVALAGARAAPTRAPRHVAGVTLALMTMHLAWGTGFLWGCAREGPPRTAITRLARRQAPR